MKNLRIPSSAGAMRIKALALAIASITAVEVQAAPTGGVVVDGVGSISQSGSNTTINQNTDRLAMEWDSFNVSVSERVQFIQPNSQSVALNRILGNSGSQILGRIDANGHVILMNPNGVFFGADAQVNVGGLVASGLNINTSDFMNGDLVFSAIAGTSGAVINQGLIQAASGGNVALLGKSVENQGLISANLGHVALASGSEAVVTFDGAGLIGVRIDQATLASELGGASAVSNSGTVEAKGGKILLNASVSQDLFSEAVNHGGMNGSTAAVLHDDGSFSLGSGNNLINTGTLDVSTAAGEAIDAGYIVLAGENIDQHGALLANAEDTNLAGQIYLESNSNTLMNAASRIEAVSEGGGGKVSLQADEVISDTVSSIVTSGNILVTGYNSIGLPEIQANHFYLGTIGAVSQSGSAKISGNTHIYVLAGADARLVNVENDFNTLSVDAGHTSTIRIAERNDITLNNLNIVDSSLYINTSGSNATIAQNSDTAIVIDSSSLHLSGDNIQLGASGSSSRVYMGDLHLTFGRSISTNSSIDLQEFAEGIYANSVHVVGQDLEYGDNFLNLNGDQIIDISARMDVDQQRLTLQGMTGANATLLGFTETVQTGPVVLSGALTWNSYIAQLDHSENDIASIQGRGGPAFGRLEYVDKNDLILRDLVTDNEVSLDIRSLGQNATLRQAPNTVLKADFIDLASHNISLGANGTSQVQAGYVLNIDFGGTLDINGPWIVGSYAPVFTIRGNDSSNRLIFGPYSTNNSFEEETLGTLLIDLGGGNDSVTFDSPFVVHKNDYASYLLDLGTGMDRMYVNEDNYIPIMLGTGRDRMRIWSSNTHYNVIDFDPNEDTLYVRAP